MTVVQPASKTAFVYDDIFLSHDPGARHPECPARLIAVKRAVVTSGLWERLRRVAPYPAGLKWIQTVHVHEHLKRIEEACKNAPADLDLDTSVSRDSFEVALYAAGGVMAAVDSVMDGEAVNAFCAVRPPGHHATPEKAMGFCLFNNVAIAARYIQLKYGIERIMIVDWDAHHGNGTQDIFYKDPSVLYFSAHQYPYYPGGGASGETGEGAGAGFNLNAPMKVGNGDGEYMTAFREILLPAAEKFRPEFVLVSAGFDAHEDDPLTHLNVTTRGFVMMTEVVKGIAESYSGNRLVSVLEGGYDVEVLGRCVVEHIKVLMKPQV
jgi:acetoin utilization deacetylase AcuC-like enzyme